MCRIFGGPNLLSVFVVKEDFGLGLLLLFTRNETEDVTLATKELNRPRPWCLTLPAPHTHIFRICRSGNLISQCSVWDKWDNLCSGQAMFL